MQSLIRKKSRSCRHIGVREIGQDYDKDGNAVRLIRCQRCGLLMREYLPSVAGESNVLLECIGE